MEKKTRPQNQLKQKDAPGSIIEVPFDHLRVARITLPCKVWEELCALHSNDVPALGATFAPYCEIYDEDTTACLLNIDELLHDAGSTAFLEKVKPLLPYLHRAQAFGYDFLLIGSQI